MMNFNVTIDHQTVTWKQDDLEQKLQRIKEVRPNDVIRKDLEVKTYSWSQRHFQRAKIEKDDIPVALRTMHQVNWLIPNQKDQKLRELFNCALLSLYQRIEVQPNQYFNLNAPHHRYVKNVIVQFGHGTPELFSEAELKSFGEAFNDLKANQGRVLDDSPDSIFPLDFRFEGFSAEVAVRLAGYIRGDRVGDFDPTFDQVIELLRAIDQFKINKLDPVFNDIERLEHKEIAIVNDEDSLELVIKNHLCSSEMKQLQPFARWISKIDLNECKSVPEQLGVFHQAKLVLHPALDLSDPELSKFKKITINLSNKKSGDAIKQPKKREELATLTNGGKKKIKIIGSQHLTSKKFVEFLLALPKNCIKTLDFHEHYSMTFQELYSVLRHHDKIKSLDVSKCMRIQDSDSPLPYAYIPTLCKQLTSLKMDNLERGSIADIACILWNLPHLKTASFRNWEDLAMKENACVKIKELHNSNQSSVLETWDLSGCQIDKDSASFNESLDLLLKLLPKTVKHLVLDGTNVAHHVIEAIRDREIGLEELSLMKCKGLSLRSFQFIVDGCVSLKKLSFKTIPEKIRYEDLEQLFKIRGLYMHLKFRDSGRYYEVSEENSISLDDETSDEE